MVVVKKHCSLKLWGGLLTEVPVPKDKRSEELRKNEELTGKKSV